MRIIKTKQDIVILHHAGNDPFGNYNKIPTSRLELSLFPIV
ncbi:hypothetical protein QP794_07310 [Paenibacillus sp. UMB7766-LJ446]|nr:hypothetical protein [Paenibacillus sp. UMB7766-LJ446]MDK8189891.1 hypothetical protein [Paenibacillus sp. UMB7766-LJ446]